MNRVCGFAQLMIFLNSSAGRTAGYRQAITAGRWLKVVCKTKHTTASTGQAKAVTEEMKTAECGISLTHLFMYFTNEETRTEKTFETYPTIRTCIQKIGSKICGGSGRLLCGHL
jgi:hypothetical protein